MTVMTSISSGGSTKIQGQHRDRLAVVYVRPSTPQQLVRHQESTRLQYGLVERALAFGWAQQRVLVIDEDLGKSADQAHGRPGFQRVVSGLESCGRKNKAPLSVGDNADADCRAILFRADHHAFHQTLLSGGHLPH